jgi:RNA polymerase sigma-70 factor (ECF subfamily)
MCVKEQNKNEAPLIRTTSLTRIVDEAGGEAWQEVVRLYGPIVYGFARKQGLRDADAADLMRDVMRDMARNALVPEYDPKHETLRSWLFTVTRNKVSTFRPTRPPRPRGTPNTDSPVNALRARTSEPDTDWAAEYERQLAVKAADRVKQEFPASIWQAFWQAAVEDRSAPEVGLELEMTPGSVHVAKCRVLARLNQEVQRLRAEAEAW